MILKLFLVVIGLVALVFVTIRRTNYRFQETNFAQAGLELVYADKTIRIKGREFAAQNVREVRWESGYGQKGDQFCVYIDLGDVRRPVHEIGFVSAEAAEQFCQRFRAALEKAGNSSVK